MADFPSIACGATAQYPSSVETQAPTRIQRYVDGTEQRIRATAKRTRQWVVRLERMSEEDARKVMDFFESAQGRAGDFRFQDPWTNIWHEQCRFGTDSLEIEHVSDGTLRGELIIMTSEG